MPAVVSCPKCQRKSRLPDTLMGKKVKCPGCGQVFVPSVDAPAPVEKPKKVAPKKVAPKKDEDEAGGYEVVSEDRGKRRRSDDDDDDERVSERPRSRRTDDDDEDEDEDRSRRRRLDDEDDEDEEDRPRRRRPRPKKRRRRGSSSSFGDMRTPLIALGVVGGVCLLLAVASFAVPRLAVVPVVLGYGISLVGGLWFLVVAFQDEVWHGLLCLCVPFYSLFYLITHWDTTWKPFCVQMIGVAVVMIGSCAGGVGEGMSNPQPPPRPRMQLQAPVVVAMKALPSV